MVWDNEISINPAPTENTSSSVGKVVGASAQSSGSSLHSSAGALDRRIRLHEGYPQKLCDL